LIINEWSIAILDLNSGALEDLYAEGANFLAHGFDVVGFEFEEDALWELVGGERRVGGVGGAPIGLAGSAADVQEGDVEIVSGLDIVFIIEGPKNDFCHSTWVLIGLTAEEQRKKAFFILLVALSE
jgi:hypothetical protein